MTKKRVKSARD